MTAIPMPVLRTSPWSKVKKYALPIIPFFLLIGVWVSVIAIADPAIGILRHRRLGWNRRWLVP